MNLYDQLLSLQVIENAYENWRDYRKTLTDFIIETAGSSESLAVFGAGRCNDVDLNRLLNHFGHLILIDRDEQAVRWGIEKQKVISKDRISIQAADFVGISPEDYRAYANLLITEVRKLGVRTKIEDLAEIAVKYLEMIDSRINKMPLDLGEKSYEVSIAIGVHSQLISMLEWIWSIMMQTIGQSEISVRNQIVALNDKYVERFNSALIKATRQRLIIGCELERVGKAGSIQGAVQTLHDMRRREEIGELERMLMQEIQWPFNNKENISYNMLISCMKVLQ